MNKIPHTEWMRYLIKITQTCEFKFQIYIFYATATHRSIASVWFCSLIMCVTQQACGILHKRKGNKESNVISLFVSRWKGKRETNSEVVRKPEIVETFWRRKITVIAVVLAFNATINHIFISVSPIARTYLRHLYYDIKHVFYPFRQFIFFCNFHS